jgi:hypothetical protein
LLSFFLTLSVRKCDKRKLVRIACHLAEPIGGRGSRYLPVNPLERTSLIGEQDDSEEDRAHASFAELNFWLFRCNSGEFQLVSAEAGYRDFPTPGPTFRALSVSRRGAADEC